MTVYKLVRIKKDGNCYPLFIDKTKPFEFGKCMNAEYHPTKGFAPRSLNGFEDNPIGGWHCCFRPIAPHLSEELKTGEKRVWIECEADGMMKSYDRPESQGGAWLLVEKLTPLRIIPWSEVRDIQDEQLRESIYNDWDFWLKSSHIRGCPVNPEHRERIGKMFNFDPWKKPEVTDAYYFVEIVNKEQMAQPEKESELWFCWE